MPSSKQWHIYKSRVLYGKPAIEMGHIGAIIAEAYARLLAMKLYAYRTLDYVHAASADDRRYQLFCAVQKAKVSTDGVKVMSLISECIGAKGFEADTYCEMALRDAALIPGLEGSMHINLGLALQFLPRYFDREGAMSEPPSLVAGEVEPGENPFLMTARTSATQSIKFGWFLDACRGIPPGAQRPAFRTPGGSVPPVYPNDRRTHRSNGHAHLGELGRCMATVALGN